MERKHINVAVCGGIVGKTTLLKKYMPQEEGKITMDSFTKEYRAADDTVVRVKFNDTVSAEKYNTFTKSFINRADSFILLFDLTNGATFF